MQPENQSPQQPPATPPTNPQQPTPPQTPNPAPQPNVLLDPNGNPIPPLTKGQKIKYSVIALIFVALVGGIIAWSVASSNQNSSRVNELVNTGTKTTGTANGEVHEYQDRSKRGGTSIRYKAVYEYYEQGQEASEEPYTAFGEKIYDTEEEVQALKGEKADVYYNGKGGSYVQDDK